MAPCCVSPLTKFHLSSLSNTEPGINTDTAAWISDVLVSLPSSWEETVARLRLPLGEGLAPHSRIPVALSFNLHLPTQILPLPPSYLCRCLHNCLPTFPELAISELPLLSDQEQRGLSHTPWVQILALSPVSWTALGKWLTLALTLSLTPTLTLTLIRTLTPTLTLTLILTLTLMSQDSCSHEIFIRHPGGGIVVLEKTLESPLDSKEIKPVHPKGNQP